MMMRLLTFLTVLCVLLCNIEARSPKNCGLSCFRWKKCMGTLSEGQRPGQLGDTGIIVLQHCGPLKKKGCECDAEQEKETKAQSQESTSAVPSRSRTNGFQPRTLFRNNRRGESRQSSSSSTSTSTTTERSLRSLFSNRSRIYRSKRLIGSRY